MLDQQNIKKKLIWKKFLDQSETKILDNPNIFQKNFQQKQRFKANLNANPNLFAFDFRD